MFKRFQVYMTAIGFCNQKQFNFFSSKIFFKSTYTVQLKNNFKKSQKTNTPPPKPMTILHLKGNLQLNSFFLYYILQKLTKCTKNKLSLYKNKIIIKKTFPNISANNISNFLHQSNKTLSAYVPILLFVCIIVSQINYYKLHTLKSRHIKNINSIITSKVQVGV